MQKQRRELRRAYLVNRNWEHLGCWDCGLLLGQPAEGLHLSARAHPRWAAPTDRHMCGAGSGGGAGASRPPSVWAVPAQEQGSKRLYKWAKAKHGASKNWTCSCNQVKCVLNLPWVPYELKIEPRERALALILFSWKMEDADAGVDVPLSCIIHPQRFCPNKHVGEPNGPALKT